MTAIAEALNLAVRHHQAGNLAQAEQIGRQVLLVDAGNVTALHLLGLIALAAGDSRLATGYLSQAVQLKPDFAEACCTLGVAYQQQGRLPTAVDCWRQVLAINPDHAEAQNNLAVVLHMQGERQAAVTAWRRAIRCKPDFVDAYFNLGSALSGLGELDAAIDCYRQVVRLQPEHHEAYNSLGNVLVDQGKLDAAADCYRQALRIAPNYLHARVNLGAVLQEQGQLDEAVACYQQALQTAPKYLQARVNLGAALQELGRLDAALTCCQETLQIQSDKASTLRSPSDHCNTLNNLGNVLQVQGKLAEALAAFQQALQIDPQFAVAHNNLLRTMQYLPAIGLAQLAQAHAEFERQHAAPLRATWRPHQNARDPERRLRLGLVSADFAFHPVGYFVIGALENLDRCQVEVVCYSDRPVADAMTDRFRAGATIWRDVRGFDDAELAEQVRQEQIDILVDLAGHTARNRLLAFARKPAPIQLTWAGYVGTTGLAAIDYLVADKFHVPLLAERYYREHILRLPDAYVCYEPPPGAPGVGPLPALTAGHVTFASFNNPAKIGPEVVRLWASILKRVPESRLVLKYRGMSDRSVADRLAALFAVQGVDPRRVECLGYSPQLELLRDYQRIDIALDPFPYSGGLTTCEALWMGVPVVTCPGETFAGRHTLSYLSTVGLTETICHSLAEYEQTAADLAGNLSRLADIRASLRQRMAASPLCDARRFAQHLLGLLRGAWRQYCASP